MSELTESIAYKQGAKAARLGTPIEHSGLRNLHPDSDRYGRFILGYDSVKKPSPPLVDYSDYPDW